MKTSVACTLVSEGTTLTNDIKRMTSPHQCLADEGDLCADIVAEHDGGSDKIECLFCEVQKLTSKNLSLQSQFSPLVEEKATLDEWQSQSPGLWLPESLDESLPFSRPSERRNLVPQTPVPAYTAAVPTYITAAPTYAYAAPTLRTDGSDGMNTNTLASSDIFDSRSSSASNYTAETNLGIPSNPLASTLTSLATTMESMRGQDSPAAHTTMARLSSTMTALATAITSMHDVAPTTPGSGEWQSNQPVFPNNYTNPYQNQAREPQWDRYPSQREYDGRIDSQDSFHSFPREVEAPHMAIDELRAEQAKLRALERNRPQGQVNLSPPPQGLQSPRPLPNFPIPAAILAPERPNLDEGQTAVPLATQHQLFAQSMATLLDALDNMGSDVHSVRRTVIEREAAFGREVTRFFHELDSAHLTSQRVEFLCTFGKRCLLAQLANTTAVTAAIEGVVGLHEAAKEQATQLADIAASLGKTRTQLEAAASASADREATLALENKRVVGEKDRIVAEKDRIVGQLQAVHSAAGEHDKAIANERTERDARVTELKKDLARLADTLNSSVEELDLIRQKGATPENWRAAENIRTQLRWAKEKVQRNTNDKEQNLSHTMSARLALVAPQAGADTIKGRRPRAPGRLPLSTVDE
ncbi:hypothetical protein CcaverHIS631_0407730 [Cutaneotrichosporon cavernicola]|nr:hypothetical protein CcaverHIS631_0407730 [Cutaneotrichosporon cavernicola]BEJ07506.1 hypothetical protein CcaverHIS641_0407750 [Cutaneotrichosporon cavernicola]